MGAQVTAAMYSTIWLALALLVIAEAAKRRALQHEAVPAFAWPMWLLGAALCAVHIGLAFASRHAWSHQSAVRETARQTAAVYGVDWGGGVYVNYLFVGVWLLEAWWWRAHPAHYFGRRPSITWMLRAFYFIIIVNAAVVFARASLRPIGIVLVGVLLWVWRPRGVVTHGHRW